MTASATSKQDALERCDELVPRLEGARSGQRFLYTTFQIGAIVLGALTPVLILVSSLPKAVQALPAALASICASLLASFHWRESWARSTLAVQLLKSERNRFLAAANPYDSDEDQENLSRFVARIERIALDEISEWHGLFMSSADNEAKA